MIDLIDSVMLCHKAAGKVAKEEGKHDIGSTSEDGFPDNLRVPLAALELVTNPHSSRYICNGYASVSNVEGVVTQDVI